MTCGQIQWLSQWPGYLVLMGLAGCLGGCSLPANPHTKLSAGPFGSYFTFSDTKDNDVLIEDAEFTPSDKAFKIKKLTIRNNSSDPRRANVEQINAYTEQVRATTAMLTQMTDSFAKMVPLSRWGAASGPDVAPDLRETVGKIIKDAVADELRRRFAPAEEKPSPEGGAP